MKSVSQVSQNQLHSTGIAVYLAFYLDVLPLVFGIDLDFK